MPGLLYSFRIELITFILVVTVCSCEIVSFYKAVITLLKNNEKPENNTRDLSIGYLLVALTYSIIGSLFFLTFPDNKGLDGNL